jgi:hypothetical protein
VTDGYEWVPDEIAREIGEIFRLEREGKICPVAFPRPLEPRPFLLLRDGKPELHVPDDEPVRVL